MKKYLLAIAIATAAPLAIFAAYNDVTLTTATVITAGGVSLNVSGSSASIESITVGASSFSVVLKPSSIISISSATGKVISTNASASVLSGNSCSSSGSSNVTLLVPLDGTATTVTVTPSTSTCVGSASNSTAGSGGGPTGGGGGGGGGGSTTTIVTPAKPAVPATPAIPGVSSAVPATPAVPAFVFKKVLGAGSINADVKMLQQFLNADPDTKVSDKGDGSPGKETNTFGPATKKAIQKFQIKYKIAKPGQDGFGTLGPKTRAKLNALAGSASVQTTTTAAQTTSNQNSAAISDIAKQLNDSLKLLQALQEQLKALKK